MRVERPFCNISSTFLLYNLGTTMQRPSVDAIRRNKTKLEDILCGDRMRILNKVHEKKLITLREYNNIKDINGGNVETHVIALVDKIMSKGEDSCKKFLDILQTDDDITDTFPDLKEIQWDDPQPESKRQKEDDQYQLTSTSLCVIINNKTFMDGRLRNGTDKDAESLTEVFKWLGFKVLLLKDLTKNQMDRALKLLASANDLSELQKCQVQEWTDGGFVDLKDLPQHGDAFVCCLLSHGTKGSVQGTDGELLSIDKIASHFNGANCPALVGKPKVFFIQACQGKEKHRGVLADCAESEPLVDAGPLVYIPVDADFLIAIATVENYLSYRHPMEGSWFIQSLCKQLKEGCPSADDIMTILYRVNNEVSLKEGAVYTPGQVKQMSEAKKVTLRKKLVFSPRPT